MKLTLDDVPRIKWLLLATLFTTLLAACGDEGAAPAPVPVATKKAPSVEPKVVDPTAQMSHAVTVGKSNAPVDLKYDILSLPVVGQTVEIDLAVLPSMTVDSLGVTVAGSAGLVVVGDSSASTEAAKSGQAEHVKVKVKANKEDVYYLTVTATVYSAGTSSPKTFAVPIIIGAIPAPAAPAATPAVATPAANVKK